MTHQKLMISEIRWRPPTLYKSVRGSSQDIPRNTSQRPEEALFGRFIKSPILGGLISKPSSLFQFQRGNCLLKYLLTASNSTGLIKLRVRNRLF